MMFPMSQTGVQIRWQFLGQAYLLGKTKYMRMIVKVRKDLIEYELITIFLV